MSTKIKQLPIYELEEMVDEIDDLNWEFKKMIDDFIDDPNKSDICPSLINLQTIISLKQIKNDIMEELKSR